MSGAKKPAGSALGSGGRAARMVEHGAAALLGIHVARSLYGRWRRLGGPDRARLEQLAEDVKRRALDLRGTTDRPTADDELRSANEALAAGMVELAEADPEVTEIEVRDLRRRPGVGARAAHRGGHQGIERSRRAILPGRMSSRATARLRSSPRIAPPDPPAPPSMSPSEKPPPTSGPDAATLEFRDATKRYPGQDEPAVDALTAGGPGGRDLRPGRPLWMREDHGHADGQPDDRHHQRGHPARRRERPRPSPPPTSGARSATRSSRSGCSPT